MSLDYILTVRMLADEWRLLAAQLKVIDKPIGKQASDVFLAECGEVSGFVSVNVERKLSSWLAIQNAHLYMLQKSAAYRKLSGPADAAFDKLWYDVSLGKNRAERGPGGEH